MFSLLSVRIYLQSLVLFFLFLYLFSVQTIIKDILDSPLPDNPEDVLVETSLIAAATPYGDEEEQQIIERLHHFLSSFSKEKKIDSSWK